MPGGASAAGDMAGAHGILFPASPRSARTRADHSPPHSKSARVAQATRRIGRSASRLCRLLLRGWILRSGRLLASGSARPPSPHPITFLRTLRSLPGILRAAASACASPFGAWRGSSLLHSSLPAASLSFSGPLSKVPGLPAKGFLAPWCGELIPLRRPPQALGGGRTTGGSSS